MRAFLLALICLGAALAARPQLSPIPWHPKVHETAPATGTRSAEKDQDKAKDKAQPAPLAQPGQGSKYHMTFDKMTTVSPGVYLAEGNVRYEAEGMLLTADAVTYDSDKGTLWATGKVAVDWEDFTVSGSELHYDVNAGTGDMRDAYGVQVAGDFTVTGSVIRKTGADWYEVKDGIMTSCTAAVSPWSIFMTKGRFHIDHYAYLTNPRFHVRQAPILYSPYLIWPIKPDRSTGFLIPAIGGSSNNGFTVSTAFYIAPADWWDDTIYADHYDKQGWGWGEEVRYALTPENYGWFHGYTIKQDSDGRRRWDLVWSHLQNLGHGWSFTADVTLLSDIDFPRDYQRDFMAATISGTESRLYLSRQWGPYAFNVSAERRLEYFSNDQNLTQETLPGVEFRSILQPLSGDLYGGFETSAMAFHKQWADATQTSTTKYDLTYGRVDVHPYAEWPLHPFLWLDVTPRFEARATGYGESLDPKPAVDEYDGGRLWRTYGQASVYVVGPRLFHKFTDGDKHVIEPYLTYLYNTPDASAWRIPVYDEIDQVPLNQSTVRLGVHNRVYTKDGDMLLDADLYQSHSFKAPLSTDGDKNSQNSPVTLIVRAWPEGTWSADLRLRFDILDHALDSESLSVTFKPKAKESADFVRLAYLQSTSLGVSQISNVSIDPPSKEIRLNAGWSFQDGRVTLAPFIARDIMNSQWRDLRLVVWYHGSCFAVGFDAGKRTIGGFQETSYRLLVSLKGVGNVVDLMGGSGTY